jgi:hypothetical protein
MESNIAKAAGSDVHTVICNSTFEPPESEPEPAPALALLSPLAESVGSPEPPPEEQAAKVLSMAAATTPAKARDLVLRKVVLLDTGEHGACAVLSHGHSVTLYLEMQARLSQIRA